MTPAYGRKDCRDGGEEERRPLGTWVFRQVSLAGNRMARVAFGICRGISVFMLINQSQFN